MSGKLTVPPGKFMKITRRLVVLFAGRDVDVGARYPGYGTSNRDYPPCVPKPGDATKLSANYYLARDTRRSLGPPTSIMSAVKSLPETADSTSATAPDRDWWKATH